MWARPQGRDVAFRRFVSSTALCGLPNLYEQNGAYLHRVAPWKNRTGDRSLLRGRSRCGLAIFDQITKRRLQEAVSYHETLVQVCSTGFDRTLLQSLNHEIHFLALLLQLFEKGRFLIWVVVGDVALLFAKVRLEGDNSQKWYDTAVLFVEISSLQDWTGHLNFDCACAYT
jgi:hypothetical protein